MIVDWSKEFPASITICDTEGKIIYLNDEAIRYFEKSGGRDLIGSDVMACHSPRAQEIIRGLTASGESNCYTVEKAGQKKLIYQAPWHENGRYMGLVEIIIRLPAAMPHHSRDGNG